MEPIILDTEESIDNLVDLVNNPPETSERVKSMVRDYRKQARIAEDNKGSME